MKKRLYPHYTDLIHSIENIERYFEIEKIKLKGEKESLFKFQILKWQKRPLVMLVAGCHGEEPAPTLALFKYYGEISKQINREKINIVIYPLINPWGFDRNIRSNRRGAECNDNWIHKKEGRTAIEVATIKRKLIKEKKPNIFVSLHEDDETNNEFYLFTFGDRKYEKPLLEIGGKYFPISKDGDFDDTIIRNGVAYDKHDGSAEDFMAHQRNVRFSCCTETPSDQALSRRIQCNRALIHKIIKIAGTDKKIPR